MAISENDDNIRYVGTVTCRWSQHRSTNIGKRSSGVCLPARITKWRNGRLNWSNWRVIAQVKASSNLCGIGDKTNACVTTVNVQPADQLWYEGLHHAEIGWINTSRLIQHEDNINWTVDRHSCDRYKMIAYCYYVWKLSDFLYSFVMWLIRNNEFANATQCQMCL